MATDVNVPESSPLPVNGFRRQIPALKVQQWMPEWDDIEWSDDQRRSRPPKWFYLFSISAADLKALSGIYRRKVTDRQRAKHDLGIQRRLDSARSATIKKYVTSGHPWSDLSEAKQRSGHYDDLRHPGWLPTAIVVNVLAPCTKRNQNEIAPDDLVTVKDQSKSTALIHLPQSFNSHWQYGSIPPIEVIDGQHRLWAFDKPDTGRKFEVPVVAFVDLDLSWQAYLFFTINIKPKKINRSLAFDLYPLLRDDNWLTKFEGPLIYRESRAQELVDLLWSTSISPWHRRINMLGDPGHRDRQVTQAAWVRSLLASFVKKWEGQRIQIGGLFGTDTNGMPVLRWSLDEQAAFLMLIGNELQAAIQDIQDDWADYLRQVDPHETDDKDPAFYGRHNLLNQDQGIRILLQVCNDLLFVEADRLVIDDRVPDPEFDDEVAAKRMQHYYRIFDESSIGDSIRELTSALATYDWRASSAPGLNDDEVLLKQSFRGSGGYRSLRDDVLRHITGGKGWVADAAHNVRICLGYG